MATSLASDMKFRDPFVQTGYVEQLTQDIEKFNASSAGALVLRTARKIGDFSYETFFKNAGGLVARQDQTSVDPVASKKIAQDQIISVKLNRRIGPVEWPRSALVKPGLSMDAIRLAAGAQAARDVMADMLNTGLAATRAALVAQGTNLHEVAASGTIGTGELVKGLAKFGDQASRISAWVMHSKVFYDLIQHQIAPANNGDAVAGAVVAAASPASLGRPIIVTDSSALVDVDGNYFTLGLTGDGVVVEETEDMYMTMQEITGHEQVLIRMQGEFAYNLGVKGFTWDAANGGKNPDATAVATAANWDKVFASAKDLAGVVVKSK